MKNNPVQDKGLLPGDDFIVVPEPQSAINITSKDTMNITVSKCTLGVFSNLSKVSEKIVKRRKFYSGFHKLVYIFGGDSIV